jgi:hypothetical protein
MVEQNAGIIGRTLRLMLAMLLGWMTFTVMRFQDTAFNLRVGAVFASFAVSYTVLHLLVIKVGSSQHRWLGALVAVAPVALAFSFGGSLGRLGVAAYIGFSLLLQTIRADSSCEVLAIPSALVKPPTHLAGILFAPIDLVEKHLRGPGGLPG